jgi:hypothetical protein
LKPNSKHTGGLNINAPRIDFLRSLKGWWLFLGVD